MNDQQRPDGGQLRDVAGWLADSAADAERRGLPQLKALLEALAHSTSALRGADWNEAGASHDTQNGKTQNEN